MSTHAAIFVETNKTDIGTYVHYDGYPSHMLHPLMRMAPEEVQCHILIAAPRGGYSCYGELPCDRQVSHGDNGPEVYTDRDIVPAYCHHVYLKHQDGSVSHLDLESRDFDTPDWKNYTL